ncbi:hypothetical protein FSP39_019325 [Pinctada imbricata]|uniref:Uncharacterized protein n=1 Tax=Pinctada imbricata TaxID=66713 RepID=A0AA89BMB0_PINIB|nr:hypothetical protein FSP39_019325 [Pinctada imbricata]
MKTILFVLSLILHDVLCQNSSTISTVSQTVPTSMVPAPPNVTEGTGGAWIRVLGRSGRIVIGNRRNPDDDERRITLEYESIQEFDQSGTGINLRDHYLRNFAGRDFSFGTTREQLFQNLTTRSFDFQGRIQDTFNAQLVSNVYIFRDSGNVTNGNETFPVRRGNIKFGFDITNWRFCGGDGGATCRMGNRQYEGAGIDLTLRIRGPRAPRERSRDQRRGRGIRGGRDFDIGEGRNIILSSKVQYDGSNTFEDMEDGYPRLVTRGSSTFFIFRFRRFNTSATYDPIVDLSASSDTPNNAVIKTSAPILLLSMFVMNFL